MRDSTSEDTLRATTDNENEMRKRIADGLDKRANYQLGIPPRYQRKPLTALVGLDNDRGVFIHGPCGTGKTHLAVGTLTDWFSRSVDFQNCNTSNPDVVRGHFQSATDFILDCKATIGRASESEDSVINSVLRGRLGRYNLVVLDDLLAVRITDYTATLTAALIDRAYTRGNQALVITCNFPLADVARLVDDRTASRIAEMCVPVKLAGADRRVAGAAA
jgi:DNA replication protein DnaC